MMTTISSERPGVLLTELECVIAVTATDLLNRFQPTLTGHLKIEIQYNNNESNSFYEK